VRRLLGSIVVHALLGMLLFAIARHHEVAPPRAPVAIEVVDLVKPPPARPRAVVEPSAAPTGGGSPAPRLIAARSPRASRPITDPQAAHGDASDRDDGDPRGSISFDDGGGRGSGGDGTGFGAGHGAGIGFGDGGGIEPAPAPPPPPPPPKISKARPARLIFPTRQRDAADGELFVMRVIIDADGFVAGARLVHGFGGRRDELASDLIWRFRYAPALDDDGHPVRSALEQRFLVQ
jgi:protein TonB